LLWIAQDGNGLHLEKKKQNWVNFFQVLSFRPRKITNNTWFVLPLGKPNMLPATTKHFDRAALHTVEQYQ